MAATRVLYISGSIGLGDSRFTDQFDRARLASIEFVERLLNQSQFVGAPDQGGHARALFALPPRASSRLP